MSNDKKAGGDVAADQAKAPIKPEEVKVTVKPRQENLPPKREGDARRAAERSNSDKKQLADKATQGATKEIRQAIKEAAPDGREAQKDAAEKAAEKVGSKLSPNIFKDVQVDIPNEHPIVKPANEGQPSAPVADKKDP